MGLSLIGLTAAKAQLNIASANTASDTELLTYIEAASEIVLNELGDAGVVTEYSQVLDPSVPDDWGRQHFVTGHVPIVDVISITPIYVGFAEVSLENLELNEDAGIIYIVNTIALTECRVVYTAGSTDTPAASLKLATALIVMGLWKTKRGAGSDSTNQDGTGYTVLPGTGVSVPSAAAQLLQLAGHHAQPGFA